LVANFTGEEGQLTVKYQVDGLYIGTTLIQGDVDGDSLADFMIVADGNQAGFDSFAL
jgi:hypothetical protein